MNPLPPAPIAVVAALPIELGGARAALSSRKLLQRAGLKAWVGLVETPAGPRTAVVAALGIGPPAVEAALETLFAEWRPAAVALVGIAGGCVKEARAGDLYACDPMLVEPEAGPNGHPIEGRAPLAAARPVLEAILRASAVAGRAIRVAPSVTINVIATTAAKDSLGRNRGAALCDMEDFWVARACARRGVPFAALRAIFDGVDDPLPVVPGLGRDPLWRIILRKPSVLFTLPRLGLRMSEVRRALDPVARALVGEMATGFASQVYI